MNQLPAPLVRSPALYLFLLGGLIPMFVSWYTWSEHRRRADVLTNGIELVGEWTWPVYWPAPPILITIWLWLGWMVFGPVRGARRKPGRRMR